MREKKKEGCIQYRLRREGGIRVKQNFQYEIKVFSIDHVEHLV